MFAAGNPSIVGMISQSITVLAAVNAAPAQDPQIQGLRICGKDYSVYHVYICVMVPGMRWT